MNNINVMDVLLWIDDIAIICFGFIGGVYFAFSFFVMHSFKKINHLEAIRIMNSINSVILKSPFMFLFFFSSFIAAILFLKNLISFKIIYNQVLSSLIFLGGMLLCTATKNVPLNKKLANFNDRTSDPEIEWDYYYKNWIKWNHIRTVSCFVAMVLLVIN
ncbi:MAG: hypothetical protein CMF99_06505 [Candidatus Marinimicrobia bacterium]|nr:hypothetical protein [Candidatus Neomarinimicrobiota bacterium]